LRDFMVREGFPVEWFDEYMSQLHSLLEQTNGPAASLHSGRVPGEAD
jgi:hypothetical protein